MAWLTAWLRLLRISGVATVFSNALAACAFITYGDATGLRQLAEKIYRNHEQAVWVLLASGLLYASGMLWNDLLDHDRDRVLHPERPLPSGRVSLEAAFVVGCLLSVGSLLVAAQIGYRGFHAAGIVLALTFCYNAVTKHLPILGALNMALVRFAHAVFVLLILDVDTFDRVVLTLISWDPEQLLPQMGISPLAAIYPWLLASWIFGTTWISELESRPGRRYELLLAGLFVILPLLGVPYEIFTAGWLVVSLEEHSLVPAIFGVFWGLLLLGILVWRVLPPWWEAVQELGHERMGRLTGRLLGSLVLLDAVLVATRQPTYAALLLLLAIAFAISRRLVRMD